MRRQQPAQIMVLFGLSIVALVALVGVVLDSGTIYLQRRTAQNSADAAALAGTRALLMAQTTPDTTIAAAICKYATANAFGPVPVPTAYFVGADGVSNVGTIALPAGCPAVGTASNAIPSGQVAGIHVDVSIPFHTYVVAMLGVTNVTATAGATAQVGALAGVAAADAPVAGCGVKMDTGSGSANIFVGGTPPTIDYATWMGSTFVLQGSQLWKDSTHPPCPIYNPGNGDWKGTIQGSGTITLDSMQPTVNGNSQADLTTPCLAAGMADPSQGTCYLAIPITDQNNPQTQPGEAHIVAFACMQVTPGNGTAVWSGTIVTPQHCGSSSIYTYAYNWTWAPGSYAIARIALTH